VVVSEVLGGKEEGAQLAAIEPTSLRGEDPRPTDILGRVGADPSVDVGEPIEPAHRREPSIDGRRRQSSLLES
jgi:hypothetical protein